MDTGSNQQPYYLQNAFAQLNLFSVRKIENGWIVTKNGKEYLMTQPSEILQFFDE